MTTLTQLLPITRYRDGTLLKQTINARDLHAFLESKQQFADWIRNRITQYDFELNKDYVEHKVIHNSMNNPQSTENKGGRPTTDYHLTLDMAKELAMVERNARGKEARQYFIQCEQQYLISIQDSGKNVNHMINSILQSLRQAIQQQNRNFDKLVDIQTQANNLQAQALDLHRQSIAMLASVMPEPRPPRKTYKPAHQDDMPIVRNLCKAGFSPHQIAEQTGLSNTWVHRILHNICNVADNGLLRVKTFELEELTTSAA